MAYVELHQEIRNHYKTEALMKRLAISRREAVGIIACLSSWAIGHRPGGIIERNLIHVAVDWEKDPAHLIGALMDIGWLDDFDKTKVQIHDWLEVTTGYRRARKDAKRKQFEREEEKKASADTKKLKKDGPKTVRGQKRPKIVRGRSAERRAEQTEQTEQTDRTDRPNKSEVPRSSVLQQHQNHPPSGSSGGTKAPEGDAGGPVVAVPEGTGDDKGPQEITRDRLIQQVSIRLSTPILEAAGVDTAYCDRLARAHPTVQIYHIVQASKDGTKTNPGGWVREALEKGWTVPESNGDGLAKLLGAIEVEIRGKEEAWAKMGGTLKRTRDPELARREGESDTDWMTRCRDILAKRKSEGKQ